MVMIVAVVIAVAMIATATVSAAAFEVGFRRDASEFQRLAHEGIDRLMNFMKFLLCIEETAGNWIIQERFTIGFEGLRPTKRARRTRIRRALVLASIGIRSRSATGPARRC